LGTQEAGGASGATGYLEEMAGFFVPEERERRYQRQLWGGTFAASLEPCGVNHYV